MYSVIVAIASISVCSRFGLAAPLTSTSLASHQNDPSCVNGMKKLFQPELHNIYIYQNVAPFPSTSNTLNIMNGSSSGSAQEQVARWTNVPSTATTCTVGWNIEAQRSFSVYNNGLVNFQQMTGLPAAGTDITTDTIKPYLSDTAKRGAMDFTFWPETPGPRSSIGGLVDCGGDVIVHLSKDVVDGGRGSITLEQTQQNGLFLQIDC